MTSSAVHVTYIDHSQQFSTTLLRGTLHLNRRIDLFFNFPNVWKAKWCTIATIVWLVFGRSDVPIMCLLKLTALVFFTTYIGWIHGAGMGGLYMCTSPFQFGFHSKRMKAHSTFKSSLHHSASMGGGSGGLRRGSGESSNTLKKRLLLFHGLQSKWDLKLWFNPSYVNFDIQSTI